MCPFLLLLSICCYPVDTSFMYVLAMLSLLRLYQNRHPDVIADSVKAVLFLAIVVAIVVCGVVSRCESLAVHVCMRERERERKGCAESKSRHVDLCNAHFTLADSRCRIGNPFTLAEPTASGHNRGVGSAM